MLLIGRNLVFLPRFTLFTDQKIYHNDLEEQVRASLAKKKFNYALYYADMNTNSAFGINEKEVFTAASVNKLPIIATLYYLNQKGKINLTEQITLQQEDIQDYGTGSLRYEKPGRTYTLKNLAKLSLQQSDNTAAHILGKRLGMDTVQETINYFGLTQTSMDKNKTSPYDMYLLFKALFHNKITDQAKTQEILGFMQDTDIEDRLPKLLPPGSTVWHKTGDAVGSLHDVGIIKSGDRTFFLGVFTSDVGDQEDEARDMIAQLPKEIIQFYTIRK